MRVKAKVEAARAAEKVIGEYVEGGREGEYVEGEGESGGGDSGSNGGGIFSMAAAATEAVATVMKEAGRVEVATAVR